jgi:methionyl-tRNA synthetase
VEQYNSEYLEESQYDEQAISIAWSKFINTHKELQSIITEEIFLELYNASSNTIKNFDDEARD